MSATPSVQYKINEPISVQQFIDLLNKTTLGARRPVAHPDVVASMLKHGNLLITAWIGDQLVGVARSLTDFDFCCYLSDLAVDETVQASGIGKQLVRLTKEQLHPNCMINLLAAPQAVDYYPKIGFDQHHSAWILKDIERLN